MTPADRLAIEVGNAIEAQPNESVDEVVNAFETVVRVAVATCYLSLRNLGPTDRDVIRVLGIPDEREPRVN